MNAQPSHLRRNRGRNSGIGLVEMLCATALVGFASAAALVTFVGVQRSLAASLYQINAQSDQNRVFAYLRRDLRGASNVQISAQGTQVTITSPTQQAPTLNLNLGLSLLSLLGPTQTPNATDTIRYYRQGTSIIREFDGVPTELSSSATLFQVSLSGATVRFDAAFQPRYTVGNRSATPPVTTLSGYVHLLNASSQ